MKYSALIGNPVDHSVSPKLFQIIMEMCGSEYAHLKINVSKDELENKINELFDLGFCGINITCPYKIDVYDIIDVFEDGSDKIHSINTIYKKNNLIYGCNTDGIAAIKSIQSKMEINNNSKVVIFGAGGVAYSILYEIHKYTNNVVVINESVDEIIKMQRLLNINCKYYDLNDKENYFNDLNDANLIINATSVGMHPKYDSIIDLETMNLLSKNKVYFDVVFNPWDTTFIKYAKMNDEIAISGGYMLINQAVLALSKWTSIDIKLNDDEFNRIIELMKDEIERIK